MPKFLVAVNGSPSSEKALETAVTLAQSQDGQLMAITILERPRNPGFGTLTDGLEAKVRARLDELLQSAVNFARSRGVPLVPVLREGHAAETILAYAEEEHIDMLVLGAGDTHRGGRGLGSTADQVSNHCACAVLLAK